jgi:hypothetical protein
MILNETNMYRLHINKEGLKLRECFSNFELYIFQIMPNHAPYVIALTVGATL